mgnify:CR=1 FL=1
MKVAMNSRKWGMTLCAVALFLPWPSFSQSQATPRIDFSRPLANSIQASQTGVQERMEEFKNILAIVDQLEERLPGSRDLISNLRGKLFQHERRQVPTPFDASVDIQETPQAPIRARRSPNDLREPAPGSDMYSSCAGLKDRALVAELREISAYQTGVDYTQARKLMFGQIDNHDGDVECVYTGRKGQYTSIPNDRDMNCEHTWPQSHGATGVAKSDIHHLFPTDSKANSTRGSLPFGNVQNPTWEEGGSKCDGDVFEVRLAHRGNVARAIFYFAVRYGKSVDQAEEATLREWTKEDPVDDAERARCNSIENAQHNRNPFIDHPEFVDLISDF